MVNEIGQTPGDIQLEKKTKLPENVIYMGMGWRASNTNVKVVMKIQVPPPSLAQPNNSSWALPSRCSQGEAGRSCSLSRIS